MNKKYLSVILFGALMLGTTGTFTSCKDYDDDINNLQSQVDGIKTTLAELQKAIENGKYVTSIVAEGNGLKITMNDGTSNVIENVINGETPKPGDVVTFDAETGEILINGEKTGYYASKDAETEKFKAPYVNDEGILVLIDEEGEEVVTGIRVAPVTAVQNADLSYTLTIWGADGKSQTVKIPSAASVLSDFELVGWINSNGISNKNELSEAKINKKEKLTVYYQWINTIKYFANNKETTWSAQKDVVKKQVLTTLAAQGVQLVTRVAPADLDMSEMAFTLQDSKGNKLPIALNTAEKFTGLLTRATSSSINLIPLDVTSDTYSAADKYTGLFNDTENGANIMYSLVETSGARSTYANFDIVVARYSTALEIPKVVSVKPVPTVVDETTDLGDGSKAKPFAVDLNTPTKLVFENQEQVYDYYVEAADANVAKEFGFSTDKKAGTITLTKASDLVSKAGLELTVYALRIDGTIHVSSVYVKPSSILDAAVTLNGGKQYIQPMFDNDGKETNVGWTLFNVSLDEMFAKMNDTDKERWQSSVIGANDAIVVTGADNYKVADGGVVINFADAQGREIVNNQQITNANAATLNVYIKYTKNADATKAALTPDKEVTLNVAFQNKAQDDGELTVINTVDVKVTPVLPPFSTFISKKTELWNDDATVLMAYFNDPDRGTEDAESKFNMVQGFKTLGWVDYGKNVLADVKFGLDGNQKLYNLAMKDDNLATIEDNVITLNTDQRRNKSEDRLDEVVAYNEDLNVKISCTYLDVYTYTENDTYKQQLADAAFKIKVQSALAAGYIKALQGSAIVMEPAAAGETWKVTAEHVGGYTYSDQPYSLFKTFVDTDEIGYKYTYIKTVEFETSDPDYYTVGAAVGPVWDADNNKEIASYVPLKPGNTTQEVNTYLKVKVTDVFGYSLTVNVPLIINKAK